MLSKNKITKICEIPYSTLTALINKGFWEDIRSEEIDGKAFSEDSFKILTAHTYSYLRSKDIGTPPQRAFDLACQIVSGLRKYEKKEGTLCLLVAFGPDNMNGTALVWATLTAESKETGEKFRLGITGVESNGLQIIYIDLFFVLEEIQDALTLGLFLKGNKTMKDIFKEASQKVA